MATLIAARKPYKVTEDVTSINWVLDTYFPENPTVKLEEYTIQQASFDPTVSEDLGVNIAPFIKDSFIHVPQDTPIAIEAPIQGEQVGLDLNNETTVTSYLGYDGWILYPENTIALSCFTALRNVVLGSPMYVTGKLQLTQNIFWFTDTGKNYQEVNPDQGTTLSSVFPVLHPSLNADGTDSLITVQGRNASNDLLWSVQYQILCPYEDAYTIGFINRYGTWEFFDVVGRVIPDSVITRESYTSLGTGTKKNYNVNGNKKYLVNTGFVCEDFHNVLDDLLLSEEVILYNGVASESIPLVVENTSMPIKSGKADKMINYQLNITEANKLIPIT